MEEKIYKKEDFCSYCAHCKIGQVYYMPEWEQEVQDLTCTKLDVKVHEALYWTEIAACHKRADGQESGSDYVPENCPIRKTQAESLKPRLEQCATDSESVEGSPPTPVFHPHAGEMSELYLYDPSDMLLGQVRTEEELLDFLMQVKAIGAKGYYVMDHGVKKEIDSHGSIRPSVTSFVGDALEYLVLQ